MAMVPRHSVRVVTPFRESERWAVLQHYKSDSEMKRDVTCFQCCTNRSLALQRIVNAGWTWNWNWLLSRLVMRSFSWGETFVSMRNFADNSPEKNRPMGRVCKQQTDRYIMDSMIPRRGSRDELAEG